MYKLKVFNCKWFVFSIIKRMLECIFLTFRPLKVNSYPVTGKWWQRICPREKCRSKRSRTIVDTHTYSLPLTARSPEKSAEKNHDFLKYCLIRMMRLKCLCVIVENKTVFLIRQDFCNGRVILVSFIDKKTI